MLGQIHVKTQSTLKCILQHPACNFRCPERHEAPQNSWPHFMESSETNCKSLYRWRQNSSWNPQSTNLWIFSLKEDKEESWRITSLNQEETPISHSQSRTNYSIEPYNTKRSVFVGSPAMNRQTLVHSTALFISHQSQIFSYTSLWFLYSFQNLPFRPLAVILVWSCH